MKKIYIKPETTVVALNVRDNVMINASAGGKRILGGAPSGTQDLGGGEVFSDAREVIQAPDAWDNEW